mgnify:CR=1 FL=1
MLGECWLKAHDYIHSANLLLAGGNGKPRQVQLRRAISTAYYALFHCLARSAADLLIGGGRAQKSKHAWRQAYRALEHGTAKNACGRDEILNKFPQPIEDFANHFRAMQLKRHAADYDPYAKFTKSEVQHDINTAEQAIKDYQLASKKDRSAFVAYVLFKSRKKEAW